MKKRLKLLASGVFLLGTLCQTALASPFVDVGDNDWYKASVDYVYDNGLMFEASEGHFLPDYPMSRGEFVSVLGRMEKIDTSSYGYSSFPDVDGDHAQSPYISWAVEIGVVTGYFNGDFGINDPITRQQMALMIEKYLDYYDYAVPLREEERIFNDVDSIGSWALPSAEYLKSIGLMTGDAKGNFNPEQDITRGETATMVTRLCKELDMVEGILGKFVGTYTAPQGNMGMSLEISREGKEFQATFSFFDDSMEYNNKEGAFLQTIFRGEGDSFVFRGDEWVEQPENYGFFDLIGLLDGDVISGTIEFGGQNTGHSFTAKRPLG